MLRSLQLHSVGGNTETRGLTVFLGVKAQLVLELRLLARALFLSIPTLLVSCFLWLPWQGSRSLLWVRLSLSFVPRDLPVSLRHMSLLTRDGRQ